MPVVLGTPACVPEGTISGVKVRIRSGEKAPPILAASSGRSSRHARSDPQVNWVSQNLDITDGAGHHYVYNKVLGGGNFAKAYLYVSETTDERLAVRVEWQGMEIDLPQALGMARKLPLARTKSFFKARLQVMELGVSTAEEFFMDRDNAQYLPQFECFIRALIAQLMANRLTYFDLKPDNIVVCRCPKTGFLYFRAIDIDSVGSWSKPKQDALYRLDTREEGVAPPAYAVVFTAFAGLLTILIAKKIIRLGRLTNGFRAYILNSWTWKKKPLPYSANFRPAAKHWKSVREFKPFFDAIQDITPTTTSPDVAWSLIAPIMEGCAGYRDRVAIV